MHARLIISAFLMSTGGAIAQTPSPPQADMNAILQAIQGLGNEVRTLREDVNKLKADKGTSTARPSFNVPAPSGTTPSTSKHTTIAGQLRNGWIVSAYKSIPNAQSSTFKSDPLAIFPYENMTFHTKIHDKIFPTSNAVSYKADGYFRAKIPGRYVFFIKFNIGDLCDVTLGIDDTDIIETGFSRTGNVFQGGVDLGLEDKKISLFMYCPDAGRTDDIRLTVRGPDDQLPRNIEGGEIVYIAKASSRSAPTNFSGKISRVVSTGSLQVEGQSAPVALAGVVGLPAPHNVALRRFLDDQGGIVSCDGDGSRYTCSINRIDIGLAAITNGVARAESEAPASYKKAEEDAKLNKRGIWNK